MLLTEYTDEQSRIFIDTSQLYDAYLSAFKDFRAYKGGMHWKKIKERQYLFKTVDRLGNGRSLGPRSEETELTYERFHTKKTQFSERYRSLKNRLLDQARFCKAARIQRVPRIVTGVLRELDRQNLLGTNLMVIGTNALYAYEAAAGVFLDRAITATQDMDVLWDVRTKLSFAIDEGVKPENFMDVLRKVDKTFDFYGKQKYRVVNQKGYMIDLLKTVPPDIFSKERDQMGGPDDIVAIEVMNLHWLLSSPKFEHIVIGDDGLPAKMIVPDPRSFALHKLWVSQQPDRDPQKINRDRNQAIATAKLTLKYLPMYPFDDSHLRMFPKELFEQGQDLFEDDDHGPSL